MTWARLDDQTATSQEWIRIADIALQRASKSHFGHPPHEVAEVARTLAQLAKSVHLITLMWSVPALTDGRLTAACVGQICAIGSYTEAQWYESAEILVEAKAWRKIRASKREPLGGYQMLLGWSLNEQPTREEDTARRALRRLRDALREGAKDYPNKLVAVERSRGRCEYCDVSLGKDGGQIDHIDPKLLSNDESNLAHACAKCNKKKGNHTLEAAGMSFTNRAASARSSWKTGKDQAK